MDYKVNVTTSNPGPGSSPVQGVYDLEINRDDQLQRLDLDFWFLPEKKAGQLYIQSLIPNGAAWKVGAFKCIAKNPCII